jgi:hypothetical protein
MAASGCFEIGGAKSRHLAGQPLQRRSSHDARDVVEDRRVDALRYQSGSAVYAGASVIVIESESDILPFALDAARRYGERDAELIQHTTGTREAATKATGSWVHGDELSYLIAIRGRFSAPRPTPQRAALPKPGDRQTGAMKFSVLVRVVDVATGHVTDSGSSNDYPDLATVGPVITDYHSTDSGRM